MAPAAARIVVAERWAILRRGVAGLLHATHAVVEEVDHPCRLSDALVGRAVDVAIVGDAVGVDVASVVADANDQHPDTHVVVLCDELHSTSLRALLQAGARGVLARTVPDHDLLDGVDRVLRGERVIDQRFLPLLFDDPDRSDDGRRDTGPLTSREHDVLVELAKGSSNRQIADALVVGESTVKSHLSAIYAKLGVRDRHRAIGRAVERGLLP